MSSSESFVISRLFVHTYELFSVGSIPLLKDFPLPFRVVSLLWWTSQTELEPRQDTAGRWAQCPAFQASGQGSGVPPLLVFLCHSSCYSWAMPVPQFWKSSPWTLKFTSKGFEIQELSPSGPLVSVSDLYLPPCHLLGTPSPQVSSPGQAPLSSLIPLPALCS